MKNDRNQQIINLNEQFKKKNRVYGECRDLCKALHIAWKQAEKEYVDKGNELAQQFHDQYDNMLQFEQDNKPYGYEFIDILYDNNNTA